MNLLRNLIFIFMFFAFLGILIFFAGVFIAAGLLLLPLVLIGAIKMKKTTIVQPTADSKTVEAEFKRVK